jgi:hypothetical protein
MSELKPSPVDVLHAQPGFKRVPEPRLSHPSVNGGVGSCPRVEVQPSSHPSVSGGVSPALSLSGVTNAALFEGFEVFTRAFPATLEAIQTKPDTLTAFASNPLIARTRAALQARGDSSSLTLPEAALSSAQRLEKTPQAVSAATELFSPVVAVRSPSQSVTVTVHALSSQDRATLGPVGVKFFEAIHALADRARRHPSETVLVPTKLWTLAALCGVTDRRLRQVMDPRSASGRILGRWLDWDAHHVSRYGEARIAGTVFAVRPLHKPLAPGQSVRITKREAQDRRWFDRVQDVRDRCTRAGFPHYDQPDKTQCELWNHLLKYVDAVLHPCVERNAETPSGMPSGTGDLAAAVYALDTGTPADEVNGVTVFARAISRSLNDLRSHKFWAKVGITVLDRLREGFDPRPVLAVVLERVLGSMREGALRRPGAVAVAELRGCAALWGEV